MLSDKYPPNRVILGEAREVLRDFPDSSIDLVVTSPPYWKLRNYTERDSREIGQEVTPEQYVLNLTSVFTAIRPKLKDTGSIWVNLGDTYVDGCPLMIPEEFARMMTKAYGWYLHNKVIWYKLDGMAESSANRFHQKWEPFYFFSKNRKGYYFDELGTKIPVKANTIHRLEYRFNDSDKVAVSRMRGIVGDQRHKAEMYLERGVDAGDVWALSTNKEKVAHPAPYPVSLTVRPIVTCCPDNGVVFDPFGGSGTTGVATLRVGGGRSFYGTDISPEFVKEANERLALESMQPSLF
jgi:DNA modification methylase